MSLLTNSNHITSNITIPIPIIVIARFLQVISTKLTILFVDKLFTTPIPFKTPEREETMWKSAQKKRVYIHNISKEIEVLSYGYSKKKVLLVHGWSGRSTQFFMIADKLLENGYMVISFDAPAHRNSEGKRTFMPEFIEIIKQLNVEFGSFESAIGHSLGGMALFNAEKDLQLKSLITIGAGDTVIEIINRFVENLSLKPFMATKLKQFYDKKFNTDVNLNSSYIQAKNIKIPTLVVHDSQDGEVLVNCAENIRKNLQNGTLLITYGLGHTKILRDNETIKRVVTFIKQNQ